MARVVSITCYCVIVEVRQAKSQLRCSTSGVSLNIMVFKIFRQRQSFLSFFKLFKDLKCCIRNVAYKCICISAAKRPLSIFGTFVPKANFMFLLLNFFQLLLKNQFLFGINKRKNIRIYFCYTHGYFNG